jgi:1-acyl-sn-glycerol-3-phosphate acyltransferase
MMHCIEGGMQTEDRMPKPTSSNLPIDAAVFEATVPPSRMTMRWAKIGWLSTWLFIGTLLVFPPITFVSLFSKTGNSMFQLARAWAWLILKVTGVHVVVRGKGKIDRSRAYMIIANHQSHFDGPALAWGLGGLQFRWIAKRELLKIPIFGHCLNSSRNIFIDRTDHEAAIASIREGLSKLPAGAGVMCFAEGTRSATGRIGPFKKGGFAAALQHGMPLLPVTINGSHHVLPKGSLAFRKGIIELVIGDPIETSGKTCEGLEDLMRTTRRTILANHLPTS